MRKYLIILFIFLLAAISSQAQYNIYKKGAVVQIISGALDTLEIVGDSICIKNSNCVLLPTAPGGGGDSLYINGDSLCIDGGNCILLPSGVGTNYWTLDSINNFIFNNYPNVSIDTLLYQYQGKGYLYVNDDYKVVADTIGGIPTTYNEFISNQGSWIFPAKYIIQDYRTIWKMQYTDSNGDGTGGDEIVKMGRVEPLIVETVSKSAINESTVKSIYFPNDVINYSLACDDLWENDTKDTCRGFIYGRYDTKNQVYLNFDWRTVDQRRWLDTVTGIYNIFRKIDAQDTSLYKDFVAISPTAIKTKIVGRGSPDNNYYSSNVVLRPYVDQTFVITKNGSDTVRYKNPRILLNKPYLRDQITDMIDTGHVVYVLSGALPFPGTVITQIINDSMFVVNNVATSSDTTIALLTINFELVAVNDIYSMTNTTITNSIYDNRVHIILNSNYKNFRFNQGISASGNTVDGFISNMFNTINFVNANSINQVTAINITNSTFGDVLNVNFPLEIQSITTGDLSNIIYLPNNTGFFYDTKEFEFGNYGGFIPAYFQQGSTNNFPIPISSYIDHSAASSDTDLVSGSLYRLDADNTLYIKP